MRVLGIAAAMAVLACSQAVHAQSQSVRDLPRAKTCSVRSTLAVAGGSTGYSRIRMSNDGGWCWMNLWATKGSFQYVPKFSVAQAPLHGELVMGGLEKSARVAYRPAADYVGEDAYTLMDTTMNSERRVTVTVVR